MLLSQQETVQQAMTLCSTGGYRMLATEGQEVRQLAGSLKDANCGRKIVRRKHFFALVFVLQK